MPVVACPSAETLAAFARGELPADELAGVADHLGGCGACGAALKFVPDDDLASLARAAAASPDTVQSVAPPTFGVPVAGRVPNGFADHPRYRILGPIGAGGMGTVYKAEDLLMGRVIAIKVVSPHLTARATAVERFRKEIRAAAQLNHPSVITAHDTGEAGGAHFLVMEFIEGVSLDRLVTKKGPLPVHTACTFARHAALGLQHAADKGMVHRDIKPQNLMATRKGQVKILDFGLARFACEEAAEPDTVNMKLPFGAGKAGSEVSAGITNPNMLMGTPDYLSPEQARNSHDVDHRSDIYSLGCTLYFLLTGQPPFAGSPTLIDKLLAHTNDAPRPVREARLEVPAGLADVIGKMMAKKPADRYQTAAEAASALHPFTRSDAAKEPVFEIVDAVVVTPSPVTRPQSDTAPVPGTPTLADTPRPKRSRKKKPKRNRGKWALLGVAALLLVCAVVFATRARKPVEAPPADPTNTAKATPPATTPPVAKDNKSEKGNKPPVVPAVIAPPKGVQVLYVIPSEGVGLPDFEPVRDRLVSKGATVTTAAADGDASRPSQRPGQPQPTGPAVPIHLRLKADMDLTDFSAVVFCGDRIEEYVLAGKGSLAAGKVIHRMQTAGKPVAAIGLGQGVLFWHGALKGKRAAHCGPLGSRLKWLGDTEPSSVMWEPPGVTVDGKLVTASGGREGTAFADALLKAIEGK